MPLAIPIGAWPGMLLVAAVGLAGWCADIELSGAAIPALPFGIIVDIMISGMLSIVVLVSPLTHFATSTRVPDTVVSAAAAGLSAASAIAAAAKDVIAKVADLIMRDSFTKTQVLQRRYGLRTKSWRRGDEGIGPASTSVAVGDKFDSFCFLSRTARSVRVTL